MNAARERFVPMQGSVCSVRELKGATVHACLAVHYTEVDWSGKYLWNRSIYILFFILYLVIMSEYKQANAMQKNVISFISLKISFKYNTFSYCTDKNFNLCFCTL